MSAVALIAVLCLRHFFGGSIGEEGSVVGSMLPLALVGCGSIFMGEISLLMNGAGRLRLGVQASEKDLSLLVSLSQWVESEGRPL